MSGASAMATSAVDRWISERLFELEPMSISVIDSDLVVTRSNSTFDAVFGPPEGKRCYEVYKKRTTRCEECAAGKTLRDGRSRISTEAGVDCVGGSANFVVYHFPVFGPRGEVTHVVDIFYDISDQRTLQTQYNVLFDRAPCSLSIINKDYRIVSANERVRERYGEVVGLHCYEIYKRRTERCIECPAAKTFADGRAHDSSEMRVGAGGGTTTYHMVSTAPIVYGERDAPHVMEMSLDVTDVRVLSERLMRESDFRRHMTDSALDAIVGTDREGTVSIFNDAAERLYGYASGEVIGKLKAERFYPAAFLQEMARGGRSLSLNESAVLDRAGEEIPVRFSGTILRERGELIGSAAYVQDLREIKALERKRMENQRLAAIGQTAAQVAHSIKNILTGLQGGLYDARIAYKQNRPERGMEGIQTLERNFKRINDLVLNFLHFSKDYEVEIVPADPGAIVLDIYQLYRGTAEQKGIAFTYRLPSRAFEVALDPRGIHTALANLVANAFDACEYAEAGHRQVTVRLEIDANAILYRVADTGCGMSPEVRERVLSDVFTTKGARGSGLGLLMTRKIAEDHGGAVEIDSVENRGTTVTVRVPCATARKEAPVEKTVKEREGKVSRGEKTMSKKILVIDDEKDVNNFLTRLLTDNGYTVQSAFNVQEAMRLIEETEVDLMLLDLQMPGETGTDLYRKLRNKKAIPTIVVSGVAGRNLAVGRGVTVLGKPIDEEKLLSEVRGHIGEA